MIDRDLIDELLFDEHDDYDRVQKQIRRIRKGCSSHMSQLKCGTDQSAKLWGSLWSLATASGRGTSDNVGQSDQGFCNSRPRRHNSAESASSITSSDREYRLSTLVLLDIGELFYLNPLLS